MKTAVIPSRADREGPRTCDWRLLILSVAQLAVEGSLAVCAARDDRHLRVVMTSPFPA